MNNTQANKPECQQYRVEANWDGGGFGYTMTFETAEQARAWGESKARFHRDAVVTVQDRQAMALQLRQQDVDDVIGRQS